MAWLYLFLAGLFEIGFTTFFKLSEDFSRLWPTIFFLLFALASLWLLNKALQGVPLGTAYAVWTGIGAFGTAIVGIPDRQSAGGRLAAESAAPMCAGAVCRVSSGPEALHVGQTRHRPPENRGPSSS